MKSAVVSALAIFSLSASILVGCVGVPGNSPSTDSGRTTTTETNATQAGDQKTNTDSSKSSSSIKTTYSRAHLYSSIQEMAKDSKAIVTGKVTSQTAGDDDGGWEPAVNINFSVDEILKGTIEEGTEIQIVQDCSLEETPFSEGETYLLYLKKSDDHYYVSGMTAGIYEQSAQKTRSASSSSSFTRADKESGDDIPNTINEDQALG